MFTELTREELQALWNLLSRIPAAIYAAYGNRYMPISEDCADVFWDVSTQMDHADG